MPMLKGVNCQIEPGFPSSAPLEEYGISYTDNDDYSESFVAVPTIPGQLSIRVYSKGYVAPGLAIFIFIDGKYHANRHRVNLAPPSPFTVSHDTEAHFLFRQKEVWHKEDQWLGHSWRFEEFKIALSEKHENKDTLTRVDFNEIGAIEVVVLRCEALKTTQVPFRPNLIPTTYRTPSSKPPPTFQRQRSESLSKPAGHSQSSSTRQRNPPNTPSKDAKTHRQGTGSAVDRSDSLLGLGGSKRDRVDVSSSSQWIKAAKSHNFDLNPTSRNILPSTHNPQIFTGGFVESASVSSQAGTNFPVIPMRFDFGTPQAFSQLPVPGAPRSFMNAYQSPPRLHGYMAQAGLRCLTDIDEDIEQDSGDMKRKADSDDTDSESEEQSAAVVPLQFEFSGKFDGPSDQKEGDPWEWNDAYGGKADADIDDFANDGKSQKDNDWYGNKDETNVEFANEDFWSQKGDVWGSGDAGVDTAAENRSSEWDKPPSKTDWANSYDKADAESNTQRRDSKPSDNASKHSRSHSRQTDGARSATKGDRGESSIKGVNDERLLGDFSAANRDKEASFPSGKDHRRKDSSHSTRSAKKPADLKPAISGIQSKDGNPDGFGGTSGKGNDYNADSYGFDTGDKPGASKDNVTSKATDYTTAGARHERKKAGAAAYSLKKGNIDRRYVADHTTFDVGDDPPFSPSWSPRPLRTKPEVPGFGMAKPYWKKWDPKLDAEEAASVEKKKTEPVALVEEEPLYMVPQETAKKLGITYQVQSGKGRLYLKSAKTPKYLDSFEAPYAAFVFKYRSKDTIEKQFGVTIKEPMTEEERLAAMSKEDLIKEMLRMKETGVTKRAPTTAERVAEKTREVFGAAAAWTRAREASDNGLDLGKTVPPRK